MQRFSTSFALLCALGLPAGQAAALGFGKVTGAATLGRPLNFAVMVRLEAAESLDATCIKAEVNLGDRPLPAPLVRLRVEAAAPGSGERRVRVITNVPVDEPVVTVNLQIACAPGLSRRFTLFADPPSTTGTADAEGAIEPFADRADSTVLPLVQAATPSPQASAPTDGASRPARPRKPRAGAAARNDGFGGVARSAAIPASTDGIAAARTSTQASAGATRRGASAKPSTGAVLRLDPVETDELIQPQLQMATTLGAVPMAASGASAPRYVDPEVAQYQRDRERLKALEAALQALRNDNQSTQKTLDDMQLRVREAEAQRYANPVVYGLAGLCVLLGLGLGLLWRQRQRDARAAWWNAPDPAAEALAAAAPAASAEPAAPEDDLRATAPGLTPRVELPPRALAPAAPSFSRPPPALVDLPLPSAPLPLRSEPESPEPRRPMSAEELIDLEQQADFFVVLGQDDAAIDLLMGHVRSTGGVSPLPYLKLLEIYRRRGEREPYDRIRERFNRRFNAYAPEWSVDPEQGLSLEGYPEVMRRLEFCWKRPSQAMDLLDASLFRRDAGPTFDVPAYRELLFLYSMARDLAEHDVPTDQVDLLLPLGEDAEAMMTTVALSPSSPASTAPPAAPSPQAASLSSFSSPSPELAPLELVDPHFSLDLDVSTDQPPLTLEEKDAKRSPR